MGTIFRSSVKLPCALALSSLLIFGCSDGSDNRNGGSSSAYKADIVWTEYGIPHVTASDWGGLGYGLGNAFAQQNFCSYMRDVVRANGQSAELLGDDGDLRIDDFVYMLAGAGMQMQWKDYMEKIAPHRRPFKDGWVDQRYVYPTGKHLAWFGLDQKESDFEDGPSGQVHSLGGSTFGTLRLTGLGAQGQGCNVEVKLYNNGTKHGIVRMTKTKAGEAMPIVGYFPTTDNQVEYVHKRYRRLLEVVKCIERHSWVLEVTYWGPENVEWLGGSRPEGLLDMLTSGAELFDHVRVVYIHSDAVVAMIDRLLSTIEDDEGERFGGDHTTGRTPVDTGTVMILSKAVSLFISNAYLVGMSQKSIGLRPDTPEEAREKRRQQPITAAQRAERGAALQRAALSTFSEGSIVEWAMQNVVYRTTGKGKAFRATAVLKGTTGGGRTQHNKFNGDSLQEMAEKIDALATAGCERNTVKNKIRWVEACIELVAGIVDGGQPTGGGRADQRGRGSREDDVGSSDAGRGDHAGDARSDRLNLTLSQLDGHTAEDLSAIAFALIGVAPPTRHESMLVLQEHLFPAKQRTQGFPGLLNLSSNCWLNVTVVGIGSAFPCLLPLLMDVPRHSAKQKAVRELGLLAFVWSYSGAQLLHTRRVAEMLALPDGFNFAYDCFHDASEVFEQVMLVLRGSCAEVGLGYIPSALSGSIAFCKECGYCNPVLHPGFFAGIQIGNGFDPKVINGIEEPLHVEGWWDDHRAVEIPHEGDQPLESCTCDDKDTESQGQLQFNSLSLSDNMVLVVQRYHGQLDEDGEYTITKLNYAVVAGDVIQLREWARGGGKVAYQVRCAVICTRRGKHFEALFRVDAEDEAQQGRDGSGAYHSGVYHANDRWVRQVDVGL